MAQGRLRKAVDKSIKAAVENGNIDLDKHAAPIAMLRYMADTLDGDPGETPAIKFVTPASFLNYCNSLGLTPMTESENKEAAKKPDGKLEAFKSSSRFAKSPTTEGKNKEAVEGQDDFDIEAFRARSRVSRPINRVIM